MAKQTDQEKLQSLNQKFADIEKIRDTITSESNTVKNILRQYLSQRKALSPEGMVKNIKSITSHEKRCPHWTYQ